MSNAPTYTHFKMQVFYFSLTDMPNATAWDVAKYVCIHYCYYNVHYKKYIKPVDYCSYYPYTLQYLQ